MSVFKLSKNIFADEKSVVMGKTGIAVEAYAIIPTLSEPNLLKISETNLFALKILFGAMSSASILFDTSSAKTISTP